MIDGRLRKLLAALAILVAVVATLGFSPSPAQALSGSGFDPTNIISNQQFYDANAMTQAQIQSFLQSNEGVCGNSNCLANALTTTTSRAADAMCAAYAGAASETTAAIIFKVQQACGISAKVILVTLQKEQGLVTATAPSATALSRAMGYACPDNAAVPGSCDSAYSGLYNQIYLAAWQLKRYSNPPGTSDYFTWFAVGSPSAVQYSPNTACGAPKITIQNSATAALYYYTPYQPDAAALANLTGVGDACSSYGNRNFWVYYNNWFGSPTNSAPPIGNLEVATAAPGSFTVIGWALDPDTPDPINVDVYVGSVGQRFVANNPRTDIAAVYPASGPDHGYSITVPATGPGAVPVCVYAINNGSGGNALLGCKTLQAMSGSPTGTLDNASYSDGTVTVSGWAVDPDTVNPINVDMYVDSAGQRLLANSSTTESATAYPGYGTSHGFSGSMTASPGVHNVCAYAINAGVGSNVLLGCQTVTVPGAVIPDLGRPPFGNAEAFVVSPTGVTVSGWALDPDTATSINVDLYVDGTGQRFVANGSRSDIAAHYPAYGPLHGFSGTMTASPGPHTVCAYAINNGAGGNTLLACKSITIPGIVDLGRPPFGNLEAVVPSATGVTASGWAVDPDTASPISVDIYLDGVGQRFTAGQARSDIAAAYPGYGALHGFSATVAGSPGTHQVCAYAINNGRGGNILLGCDTVTIPGAVTPDLGRPPIGNLEAITVAAGAVTVSGWALDPDTAASINVDVYVDSTGQRFVANRSRPDIANVYPAYGPLHGFSQTVTASPGTHNVCVYAINAGPGGNSQLGCQSVTVPGL